MRLRKKDIAYEKIHEMILSGELRQDEIINESRLAEELEISRTPLREALQRLEVEGYIKIYPNRGSIVNKMGLDDIIKVSEMRQALECFAARKACEKADKNLLKDIKKRLESLSDLSSDSEKEEAYVLGRKMHNEILKSTGNELIIKEVRNIMAQINRVMLMCREVENRENITYEQHMILLNAILDGNSDEAEKAMRNHLISVTNDVINLRQMQNL